MNRLLAGILPATQNQLALLREEIMGKLDSALNKLADKIDHAADRIEAN